MFPFPRCSPLAPRLVDLAWKMPLSGEASPVGGSRKGKEVKKDLAGVFLLLLLVAHAAIIGL